MQFPALAAVLKAVIYMKRTWVECLSGARNPQIKRPVIASNSVRFIVNRAGVVIQDHRAANGATHVPNLSEIYSPSLSLYFFALPSALSRDHYNKT